MQYNNIYGKLQVKKQKIYKIELTMLIFYAIFCLISADALLAQQDRATAF